MEEKQKIDILNRSAFINRVVGLIEVTADNKENRTFAIDGEWGSGKTWVLEEIEDQLLSMEKKDGKCPFLVVHFNCWENDYYQEPIIAIVSALLNFVESTKVLPSRTKGAVKKVFAKIGEKFLSVGSSLAQPFIGVNIEKTVNEIRAVSNEANQEELEKYGFDKFYGFKETVLQLKKEMSKLAKKYSIVICVDELDRCLPEYAIKVLERLHHVFEGITNLQVVLSIDKSQLENTVKTIFGESVNTSRYLTKFIDFTISLPHGDIDKEKFEILFADYVKNFKYSNRYTTIKSVDNFINKIFANTNIRKQIKIIEKAKLIHSILPYEYTNMTLDYMAVEILFSMISFIYPNMQKEFSKEVKNFNDVIDIKDKKQKELWLLHSKVFIEEPEEGYARYVAPEGERSFHLFNASDTWSLLYLVLLDQYRDNYGNSNVKFDYKYQVGYQYDQHYAGQVLGYASSFFDIIKSVS